MMENKYPEYILRKLRQREGLGENDTSMDNEFNKMKPNRVFKEVCQWEGLLGGWDESILEWIKSIYGIDLVNEDLYE